MPVKKAKTNEMVISFSVDGVTYRLAKSELQPAFEMELPNGKSMAAAIHTLNEADGGNVPWAIATLMFLARRCAGEKITFAEVLGSVNYDIEIEVVNDPGDDSPEA